MDDHPQQKGFPIFEHHQGHILLIVGLVFVTSSITWKMHPQVHLLIILAGSQFLICFFLDVLKSLFQKSTTPSKIHWIQYYFLINGIFLLFSTILEYLVSPKSIIDEYHSVFIIIPIISVSILVAAYIRNRTRNK